MCMSHGKHLEKISARALSEDVPEFPVCGACTYAGGYFFIQFWCVYMCLFVEDMFEEYLHYVTVTYDCFRVLVGR